MVTSSFLVDHAGLGPDCGVISTISPSMSWTRASGANAPVAMRWSYSSRLQRLLRTAIVTPPGLSYALRMLALRPS